MHLIVGIDPGKTVGIACLDLNGRLVLASHMPNAGMGWITNTINSTGTPSIIASDKPNASSLVRKINAYFNSRLFSPDREFKIEEKRAAARRIGIKNPHERDAYVAAISAYHAFENKFKQIERKAASERYADAEAIKAKVIAKYSISEAVEDRKANRK
jgi:predicted RNase H-like nuclease (RuvC/YqgF family)